MSTSATTMASCAYQPHAHSHHLVAAKKTATLVRNIRVSNFQRFHCPSLSYLELSSAANAKRESLFVCNSLESNLEEPSISEGSSEGDLSGWPEDWTRGKAQQIAMALLIGSTLIVPELPRFQGAAPIYFASLALWAIYVGSHKSLEAKATRDITMQQSFAVPVMCSITLFGLYCLLKFFPDLDLATFFNIYLNIVGSMAVASNLAEPLQRTFPSLNRAWTKKIELPPWLLQSNNSSVHYTLPATELLSIILGVTVCVASHQPWIPFTFTNFVAICITTELIQLVSLGKFATAAVMLTGLLFYDVFWVFGSSHVFGDNVMVTVATSQNLDGPMKLIFPNWSSTAQSAYSILGLGDIAAPGLLVALMLRFDKQRSLQDPRRAASKPYFLASLAFYTFGLATTIGVNMVTMAAQPALLYLVPSLLGGVFLFAVANSELGLLWEYRDATEEERKEAAMAVPVPVQLDELSELSEQ